MKTSININEFYLNSLKGDQGAELMFVPLEAKVNFSHLSKDNDGFCLSFVGSSFLKFLDSEESSYSEGIHDFYEGYLHLSEDFSYFLHSMFDFNLDTGEYLDPNASEEVMLAKQSNGFVMFDGEHVHVFAHISHSAYRELNNRIFLDKELDFSFIMSIFNPAIAKNFGAYFFIDNLTVTYCDDAGDYYFGGGPIHIGFITQELPPIVEE